MHKNEFTVIDLFSGCGGLSNGFEQANYNVILGIDNWKDAILTYEFNHKESKGLFADLSQAKPQEIANLMNLNNIDVVIGGPPCQGFSIAGKRIIDDERNKLYETFIDYVDYFKPKAFIMENVPNILTIGDGIIKDNILKRFTKLGYNVVYKTLLASNYGVPQNRKRAVFVGLKGNNMYEFPKISDLEPITSFEAISDLPEGTLKNGSRYISEPKSEFQRKMRLEFKYIYNHEITMHNEKTTDIISRVPNGGNYKDLPHHLINSRKVNIAWTRLDSNKPSFTIDTGHRHHFHYLHNRVPTVRESARLQSFNDSFIFLGSKTSQYKQVGNAVPPMLAKEIAIALRRFL